MSSVPVAPTVLANVAEPPEAQTAASTWESLEAAAAGTTPTRRRLGVESQRSLGCEPGCQRLLGKPLLGSSPEVQRFYSHQTPALNGLGGLG